MPLWPHLPRLPPPLLLLLLPLPYFCTPAPSQDLNLSVPGVRPSIISHLPPQDLLLGGLFPIHQQGEDGQACGDLQDEDGGVILLYLHLLSTSPPGIQPLEALLFTLDQINANPELLPNISLGLVVW